MAQTSAHLVDYVIPHVPVRQWALSPPIPLRLLLAVQPKLVTPLLQVVWHKIIIRRMKLLTRRGVLIEEEGSTCMADSDGDSDKTRGLRPLQAAACTYRFAFGPRAGQKVLMVQGVMPPGCELQAAAVCRHRRIELARCLALRGR